MATYKEIQTQIAALQAQAEESRAAELDKAVREINTMMQDFGITIDDLQENKIRVKKGSKNKSKNVQFRDGENTWSGRGRMPGWMQGKEKEKFRV